MVKNLLIITQKVDENDQLLGFFLGWIKLFAEKFEAVTVLCLEAGQYDLPHNVRILSLGKDRRLPKIWWLINFYKYIFKKRKEYDSVFVHMNPRYVVYGGWLWKLMGKKVSLWYAHGHVNLMLKMAATLADMVFTSTSEGFRLKNKKTIVVGQGIDTNLFKPNYQLPITNYRLKVISVGRISPSKDYETLIRAIKLLADDNVFVEIAGQPAVKNDSEYLSGLKIKIRENNLAAKFNFIGLITNRELPKFLQSADIFVNMSHTGSLDKAILEAMACGLPVLTCNEALRGVLGPYAGELMYPKEDYEKLANSLRMLIAMSGEEREKLGLSLREIVVRDHNLTGLIDKIASGFGDESLRMGEFYNRKIVESYKGDYERGHWFKNPVSRANYEMTRRSIIKHFLKDISNFEDYLELGPGPGTWTKLFIEKNSTANFDLVDISSGMLGLAKQSLTNSNSIRYFEKDFLDFKSDKKYDLFLSSRVLEYINDKDLAVRKISDLLRSGGRGFIITKTPKSLRHKLLGRRLPKIHQQRISPENLARLLLKNKMEDIEIYPITIIFPLLRSAFMNNFLYELFGNFRLNIVSKFFSESYGIKFRKQ